MDTDEMVSPDHHGAEFACPKGKRSSRKAPAWRMGCGVTEIEQYGGRLRVVPFARFACARARLEGGAGAFVEIKLARLRSGVVVRAECSKALPPELGHGGLHTWAYCVVHL